MVQCDITHGQGKNARRIALLEKATMSDTPTAICEDCGWEGTQFDLISDENDDQGELCPECGSEEVTIEWN